ncbi:MAG: glycosyltransferase family 2 protein [Clostridia bacterium]|nr:glycosyltransferase family 2 protein [Clostridia bacterium]
MYSLTVFTPTYNRAEYLKKCYQSLVAQSNTDFVWQIVDDGSTDGTKELIESYINEKKIAIAYRRKENGGKASAINLGLETLCTPFWVCLDSDDYLFEDAVDIILRECEGILDRPDVCGVFAVRSDTSGLPMKGKDVPYGVDYATQTDIRYKYGVEPEYVQVYKSEIIKTYRFPTYEGEKFVTESWLQDQLDCKYVFKVFRYPVMACEYLQDGLTHNYYRLIRKNPKGFLDFYGQRTELCRRIKPRVTAAIMYNAVYAYMKDRTYPKKKNAVIRLAWIPGLLMKRKLGKGD